MNASALNLPSDVGRHPRRALSWKATLALGAIVFWGSLGLAFLAQEWIFGDSRSAGMRRSDPGYRMELLEKAVSRYPNNAGAWVLLGHAYGDSGRVAEAVAVYENVVAIDSDRPDIWTKLGLQYTQAGRPEKALEAFNRAISLNPTHEAAHLYKGALLLNAFNDLRGAIRAWMPVLTANPDAEVPEGRSIEEWINYCQAAAPAEISGGKLENK